MDENQFPVNHGNGMNYISGIIASAGRVSSKDIPLEIIHPSGDVISNGKGKVTLGKVNLPIPPGPCVDGAKPGTVNLTGHPPARDPADPVSLPTGKIFSHFADIQFDVKLHFIDAYGTTGTDEKGVTACAVTPRFLWWAM